MRLNFEFRPATPEEQNGVCELPLCIPANGATHAVEFTPGEPILICQEHASGIEKLSQYFNTKIELEPNPLPEAHP